MRVAVFLLILKGSQLIVLVLYLGVDCSDPLIDALAVLRDRDHLLLKQLYLAFHLLVADQKLLAEGLRVLESLIVILYNAL